MIFTNLESGLRSQELETVTLNSGPNDVSQNLGTLTTSGFSDLNLCDLNICQIKILLLTVAHASET